MTIEKIMYKIKISKHREEDFLATKKVPSYNLLATIQNQE